MKTRTVLAIWTLGLLVAAGAVLLVLASDHVDGKAATLALAIPSGLAFIGSGLIARSRRPHNATGLLLLAVGFAWFLAALPASDHSILFTSGIMLESLFFGFFAHLLLAFPSGQLEGRGTRFLVMAIYLFVLVEQSLLLVFKDTGEVYCDGADCPDTLLTVAPNETVAGVLGLVALIVAASLSLALIVRLVRRWRSAAPALRRALAPPFVTAAAVMLILVAKGIVGQFSTRAAEGLNWLFLAALLMVPLAFLFGLLRSRLVGTVGRLAVDLEESPDDVEQSLRKALGDPTLRVAYAAPEGFVDAAGQEIELPDDGDQTLTMIKHDGNVVGALLHDASLREDPGHLEGVAAAAGLAIETAASLRALSASEERNRALLDAIRRSRARIVEAGDAERRRLERNLHDGAQQRLVSLSLALRLAQTKVGSDTHAVSEILSSASVELAHALEELRELARGIHPAVLTDRGLGPALESLANLAPIPVELASLPDERLPGAVEAAAFYVVSESLANVAKYARASTARVSVMSDNGCAIVEVLDDGVGGADAAQGSGLRGLADRVESLDGRLEVKSELGRGTRIRAEIPCA